MPDVAVIVPARNAERSLPDLVACLARQTLPRERFELIVVDDASTDGTAEVAREAATVVSVPVRSGSYVARNLGIERAGAPVLAFTDADCRPEPRWLEAGLEALSDPEAGLVGGHIEVPLSPDPTLAELIDARFLDQASMVAGGDAATANLFVRASVLASVGPFNARLTAGGDTEFTRRAVAAGHRLVYSREAAVVHPPRRRIRDVVRKTYRMGAGRTQLSRHGAPGTWARRPLWTHPGAWLPGRFLRLPGERNEMPGLARARAQGYEPNSTKIRALELLEWATVQVPMVAGGIVETLRRRS
ncbi:MAG TPA: glycosyltransferase [Thermoleophilaceae bacterium]|nr:glycosyltransferase [Thermoleophilaceae bacterium]